jgi:hypothetical protein
MKTPTTICFLFALLALIILPVEVGAADLELQSGKITAAKYLRLLNKSSFCNKDSTIEAIRSAMETTQTLKKLYQMIARNTQSPEILCLQVKRRGQDDLETIKYYESLLAACRLQPKDLAPLFAEHRDTVSLMNRVCSPASVGQLPDIMRFDEYKMPPFPN